MKLKDTSFKKGNNTQMKTYEKHQSLIKSCSKKVSFD